MSPNRRLGKTNRSRLLTLERFGRDVESQLASLACVVHAYREQDSGCISYVVEDAGRRFFVKQSISLRGAESLERAANLHDAARHSALPPLLRTIPAPASLVHIYTWVPGEVLYDYVTMNGEAGRRNPASAHARFRALPIARILSTLDTVYDVHVALAAAGFIAVDFYDGCILYDFTDHRTWVCDLDEYRLGSFALDSERLPGSRRFMAPEESLFGSTIDQRTNVFTLGRTAAVLLSDGDSNSRAWRGTEAMRAVLHRATQDDPADRFPSVLHFVSAWREAVAVS